MFRLDELMNENILLRGFGNRDLHSAAPFSLPSLSAPAHLGHPNSRGQAAHERWEEAFVP